MAGAVQLRFDRGTQAGFEGFATGRGRIAEQPPKEVVDYVEEEGLQDAHDGVVVEEDIDGNAEPKKGSDDFTSGHDSTYA